MGADLANILDSTGFPVAYLEWKKKPPELPYIVYFAEGSDSFGADNIVYHSTTEYQIELYSELKDPAAEAIIEAALTANEIYYDKLENYIKSEAMYQVVYSITI